MTTSMDVSPEILDTFFHFDEVEPVDAKNAPLVLHMECLKLCDIRL